jgi:hypothetical protein
MFRRMEEMIAGGMPPGYRFLLDPDQVATRCWASPPGRCWR